MSEMNDPSAFDPTAFDQPGGDGSTPVDHPAAEEDTPSIAEPVEAAQDLGWSEVASVPPPDALPGSHAGSTPPHELAVDQAAPPPPAPPGSGDVAPPPAPPAGDDGLPPALPVDPVDLTGGEGLGGTQPPLPPGIDATADVGRSPVPTMGTPTAEPAAEVLLEGGPAVLDDPTVPLDPAVPDLVAGPDHVELPALDEVLIEPDVAEAEVDDGTGDSLVFPPEEARVWAEEVTGLLLDGIDADPATRDRLIELLTVAGADGQLTVDELEAAVLQAGFEQRSVEPTEENVINLIDNSNTVITTTIPGEGRGPVEAKMNSGQVELRSPRTGSVYSVSPAEVARAWQANDGELLAQPIADEAEAADEDAASGDEGPNKLRNALVAGAVLLPLAGAGTYLATRKIR